MRAGVMGVGSAARLGRFLAGLGVRHPADQNPPIPGFISRRCRIRAAHGTVTVTSRAQAMRREANDMTPHRQHTLESTPRRRSPLRAAWGAAATGALALPAQAHVKWFAPY